MHLKLPSDMAYCSIVAGIRRKCLHIGQKETGRECPHGRGIFGKETTRSIELLRTEYCARVLKFRC